MRSHSTVIEGNVGNGTRIRITQRFYNYYYLLHLNLIFVVIVWPGGSTRPNNYGGNTAHVSLVVEVRSIKGKLKLKRLLTSTHEL